jgi:serine/threonine protein kinase
MARWKVAFDELSLEKRIGKGNFGEVWVGKYLGLDVAIKRLFFTDDEFMQKYIEREMDTLTYVFSHPHITISSIPPPNISFFFFAHPPPQFISLHELSPPIRAAATRECMMMALLESILH